MLHDLLARFPRREPLALALECIARYPRRTPQDDPKARAQAFLSAALAVKAGVCDGELVWNHFTCGYFKRADGLAVVPVWGDLGPMRTSWWSWVWYEDLAGAVEAAAKDGDVKAVLLHIDSPGGYVAGLPECAAAIERAAAQKPFAAYANDFAASAAYWIACAAGPVSASPTAELCSIAALKMHEECSAALEQAGIKINLIRSAARKAESNPFEPLSPAALQYLQSAVAQAGDMFTAAVVRLRKLDEFSVKATQGALLTADQALAARFVDSVCDLDSACSAVLGRVAAAAPLLTTSFSARAAKTARAKLNARLSANA